MRVLRVFASWLLMGLPLFALAAPVVVVVSNPNPAVGEQVTVTATWDGPIGNPWVMGFQYQRGAGPWQIAAIGQPPRPYVCTRSPCSYWLRSNQAGAFRVRVVVYNPGSFPQGPPVAANEPTDAGRSGWMVAQQKQTITWRQTPSVVKAAVVPSITLIVNGVQCVAPSKASQHVTASTCANINAVRRTPTASVARINISYSTQGFAESNYLWAVRLYVGTTELPAGAAQWPYFPIDGFSTFHEIIAEQYPAQPCMTGVTAVVSWAAHPDYFNIAATKGVKLSERKEGNPGSGVPPILGAQCIVPVTFIRPPPAPPPRTR